MTADRFSPIADDDPDGPSRLRTLIALLFVLLFSVFLFEAMDGIQRAAEQAERRENSIRSFCREPAWDVDDEPEVASDRLADHIPPELAAAAATTDPAVTHPPATNPIPVPVTPAEYIPDYPPAAR